MNILRRNKKILLILGLIISSLSCFSQNQEEVNLIAIDSTWGKEIFTFPIRFARNINYEGVEEARFPPKGWRDENHQNFWSYAFAWDINLNRKITEKDIESDLEKYFDGLAGIGVVKGLENYKASAVFVTIKDDETSSVFKGKIKTYDGFATKKAISLYVLVESYYCKKEKKSIILFRFSPQNFKHDVWKTLKTVKLTVNNCVN